jgi:hypothetical protein
MTSIRLCLPLLLASAMPLAAQEDTAPPPRGGWIFGVVALQGADWNPTAFELGVVRGVGSSRANSAYAGLRFGGWTNETGIIGGTRGWSLGLIGGYRHNLITLMEIGTSERELSYALLTGSLEFSANLDHDSPTPDKGHATAAFLFGLTYSDGEGVDQAFAILAGPAAYIGGNYTDLRLQVGVRFQSPFGRRR